MSNRMTLADRYTDISQRSGLSENIVKRVLAAQAESTIESLKHGEAVTIPQLCTIVPDLRRCLVKGTLDEGKFIHVKAVPLVSLKEKLGNVSEYKIDDTTEEEENIRVSQIGSLM